MDLKRAWRNGFLISVVFALPLSDLYNFQQSNLIADGTSNNKPVQQAKNCADSDCGLENGVQGNDAIDTEDNGLMIPGESRSGLMLESSGNQSGSVWNTALHFSPQDILRSVDLTGEENQNIADDVQQLIDMDVSSMASLSYEPGGSSFYLPAHSGPFSPAGFNGGSSRAGSGSLNSLSDDGETSSSNEFSDSSTQTETDVPGDSALQNVPEPSSLVLMTIGTISVAALLRLRKPRTPTSHA